MLAQLDEAALALCYRLLGLAFAPPRSGHAEELSTLVEALATAGTGDAGLDELIGELGASLEDPAARDALGAAYQDLFGGGAGCAPYEGSFERDPFRATRQLADVAGIYRAFGAGPGGPAAERADHVGCELEFLGYLLARRLQAERAGDGDDAEVCREAENVFLEQHAGRWLPELAREIVARSPYPFFTLSALLTERVVAIEVARRGLLPRSTQRGTPTAVETDEVECGAELGSAG